MPVRLTFEGLEELKADLRHLPRELADEGVSIVFDAANGAADAIIAEYQKHKRSGNLSKGVSVNVQKSAFGTVAIVQNKAPHAFIFENGTQARHTKIGANRGSMPPGHVFVPIVMRKRRAMYQQLRELLQRAGLVVIGDAA